MITFKKKLSTIHYSLFTNKGFTLIELVVTITILAILSGLGFASFVTYSRSQVLEQSAGDMKTAIEKARYSALSKIKPSQCTALSPSDDTVSSYEVDFCASCTDYSYRVTAKCGKPVENSVVVLAKKLSQNVSLGSITCQKLRFLILSNIVQCGDVAGSIPSSVAISAYGKSKTISIDQIGNVSIQ